MRAGNEPSRKVIGIPREGARESVSTGVERDLSAVNTDADQRGPGWVEIEERMSELVGPGPGSHPQSRTRAPKGGVKEQLSAIAVESIQSLVDYRSARGKLDP